MASMSTKKSNALQCQKKVQCGSMTKKKVQCYNVVRSLLLCRFIAVVGAMVAVAAIAAVAVAVATAPIQLFNINNPDVCK